MLPFQPGPAGGAERRNHRNRVAALTKYAAGGAPTSDLAIACDEFDDAVESAIFERIQLSDAMTDYISAAECAHSREVIGALRALTAPILRPRVTLPVLPSAMSRVLNSREEDLDAASLAAIAAKDQVLAGRLLSLANSASHGTRHKIVTLRHAVMRLGVPLARKALLHACVGGLFASVGLRDLWRHAQVAAAASAQLALLATFDTDAAYAAGLLHDIGRLEYAMDSPANQRRLNLWLDEGFPVTYAESMVYGIDHARCGAEILRFWRLPDEIVDAVAHHHTPESAESALASILFIAEVWCEQRAGSRPESLNANLRLRIACDRLGIPENVVGQIEPETRLFALARAS